MSQIYTYGSLYSALQTMVEDTNADFQAFIPDIMQKGELRLLRDLDLDNLDYSVTTTAISTSTGLVAKPTGLARERDVVLVTGGANLDIINRRSFGFVTSHQISGGAARGQPKYYGEYDETNWVVSPIPTLTYTLNVRGIYPPKTLGDNTQYTNLAAVVALAHTVAATPLTLTTTPYVFSPAAVPVALTSTGDMSANVFTIVGLDSDGNALTVAINGPNASTVLTTLFFSSISSITPSLTDGTNFIRVGYSQANTTWLSTRYADLLFMSCLIDACHYLKRFTARELAVAEYSAKIQSVTSQTRTLRRADLDDIVTGRMNVTAPQVPPPGPPMPQQGR